MGEKPGSDASHFSSSTMKIWRKSFYKRLKDHVNQTNDSSINKETINDDNSLDLTPHIFAFSGKRQFQHLFDPPLKKIETGLTLQIPPQWPFKNKCQIFILNSSSGRAVLTKEERYRGYKELAELYHSIP